MTTTHDFVQCVLCQGMVTDVCRCACGYGNPATDGAAQPLQAPIAVQPVLASDLVFGHPRELFRVTPAGDVVVSEGVSTTDAARAFWEAVAQMCPRPDAGALNQPSGNSGQLQQPGATAGLNEPFGDSEQLARPNAGSDGDAPIDVTDPWRGLYLAERLRAHTEYGDVYHPDLPSWPDDREDALDKLVHAQGFDFQVIAGEFSDEAIEDGGDLYWQEMRAWNPEAPEGDWRLAWKGDTEDGPYAWFVRPMALRPVPEALATRQTAQGGTVTGWRMIDGVTVFDVASHSGIVEPQQFVRYADYLAARRPVGDVDLRRALEQIERWELPETGETWPSGGALSYEAAHGSNGVRDYIRGVARQALAAAPPAQADRMAIKMLVAAGFVSEDKANESLRIAHGFGGDLGQPAPAAMPAPDLLRTIAQLNRMRIVLRNARAYVENFTCKSALPPIQQKMIGQIDEVIGALAHAWPAAAPASGPLAGKYGDVLRPFVAMMERELHANTGKGDRPGWLCMDARTAMLEIYYHVGKLQRAVKHAHEPAITEYAADVANMAMMLVDVCGLLPVDNATQPQPAGEVQP